MINFKVINSYGIHINKPYKKILIKNGHFESITNLIKIDFENVQYSKIEIINSKFIGKTNILKINTFFKSCTNFIHLIDNYFLGVSLNKKKT